MEKSYLRLLTRLHNTPILMSEEKLRIITEAVTIPLMFGQSDRIDRTAPQTNATVKEFASTMEQNGRKLGIITAFDSLVSKEVSAASGMTSYEHINMQIDSAIAAGYTDLGFYLDTPGGEATGLFGLTEKIRSLPSRGISTFAFVDNATSAGYAIAAATQTIYATETSHTGSIAALMVHAEQTAKAEKDGITYTVFRSKELKAIGDSYTKLSDAAKEKFTSILEGLDKAFNNDVIKSRPQLTLDAIVGMKGASFMAEQALPLKLIDKIVPNLETALSDYFKNSKTKTTTSQKGVKMNELELAQSQLAETLSQIAVLKDTHKVALAETAEAATMAERARCSAILTASETLRINLSSAISHISKGYSAETSLEIMTDTKAAIENATALNTSTGAQHTTGLDENAGPSRMDFMKEAYKSATGL